MYTMLFVLKTVFSIYTMLLLLRVWMQWVRCDFYNPLAQVVVKTTQPIIAVLRRFIPAIGPIDTASVLFALLISVIQFPLYMLIREGSITFYPIILLYGVIFMLKQAGMLVFWIIIARSILSWVSQGRSPIEYVLLQLTEPLMGRIRRILPDMGGIDFSPMILILILYALNYLGIDIFKSLWLAL